MQRKHWIRGGWRLTGPATLLGLLLLLGEAALAGKPPKDPPPPPTPVDAGTVYLCGWADEGTQYVSGLNYPSLEDETSLGFNQFGTVHYQVEPDGTDLTARRHGIPSLAAHDGQRWYLELRYFPEGPKDLVPDRTQTWDPDDYPQFLICATRRMELFAVREDGLAIVQLTNDPTLRFNAPDNWGGPPNKARPTWAVRNGVPDGKVSFLGIRWNAPAENGPYTVTNPTNPVPDGYAIVEAGLYVIDIDWQNDVPVVSAAPTVIDVGDRTEQEYFGPQSAGTGGLLQVQYVWSPDGNALAFTNYVYSHDNESSDPPEFPADDTRYPTFHPERTFPGVWRLDSASGWTNPVHLTEARLAPSSWHPGGAALALEWVSSPFQLPPAIYVVDPTQNGLQTPAVLVALPQDDAWLRGFSYSPAGNQAVYTALFPSPFHIGKPNHSYTSVYRVAANGQDPVEILNGRSFGRSTGGGDTPRAMAWRQAP